MKISIKFQDCYSDYKELKAMLTALCVNFMTSMKLLVINNASSVVQRQNNFDARTRRLL